MVCITSLLVLILIATQTVWAGNSRKKCKKLLEGIIYSPGGCILQHMERIMETLEYQAPLLWTPQNASIIDSFKATNNVGLSVINAFGQTTSYVYDTEAETLNNLIPSAPLAMFSYLQRSNVVGHGFAADELNYYYTSKIRNCNAQIVTIKISLLKSDAPFICYEF
jgi:hypothetical protein